MVNPSILFIFLLPKRCSLGNLNSNPVRRHVLFFHIPIAPNPLLLLLFHNVHSSLNTKQLPSSPFSTQVPSPNLDIILNRHLDPSAIRFKLLAFISRPVSNFLKLHVNAYSLFNNSLSLVPQTPISPCNFNWSFI